MALPFEISLHFLLAGQMPMQCQVQICPGCGLSQKMSRRFGSFGTLGNFGNLMWFWSINETSRKSAWRLLQAAADRLLRGTSFRQAGMSRFVTGSTEVKVAGIPVYCSQPKTFSSFICSGRDYFTHIRSCHYTGWLFGFLASIIGFMHAYYLHPFVFFRLAPV